MEENNIVSQDSSGKNTPSSFNAFTPVPKKVLSKKALMVIVAAFVMLVVLSVYYFMGRKVVNNAYVPTVQEKSAAVEETIQETKDRGLPEDKKQIDIMKFNSQE
jgi:uncharacterized membrane protein YvbJ